ncbi:MAG: HAMP domain-containing protein [Chloroflexi bacterium]|nr:HAMP domain-containing protein [Chloroflexota bacterium]
MRSLSFKLTLAFVLTAVISVGVASLLIGQLTAREFGAYLEMTGRHLQMMGTGGMMVMGPQEQDFLGSVSAALWLTAGAGVLVALGLSLYLARQTVAPLQRLTLAAQAIAGGDRAQRVAVASRDEVGQLAAAFNTMAEALARDEELRRHMAADIAHELRTPLTVLQGQVEAMLDGVMSPTKENLAVLQEEVLLLSRLVTDLRTLSLAEAGQLELRPVPTDLAELAQKALSALELQAAAKGVRLAADFAPSLPLALADPDRVAQVLGNLLSNALRYSPSGGEIRVEGQALLETQGQEGCLAVSVTDTGPGISPEALPHLFERFYRADPSRSRASGGSGLGLAIVKQLVEAQGGRVAVESPPEAGRGATFTFTLPAAVSQSGGAFG